MKKQFIQFTAILVSLVLVTSSCKKKDDPTPEEESVTTLNLQTATDIKASSSRTNPTANKTYYSLRENKIVDKDQEWDIAILGTNIYPNSKGGVKTLDGLLDGLNDIGSDGYTTEANKSWYSYTGSTVPQHAILPKAGKVLAVKTADGKYAKIEIISYYKGNPDTKSKEFEDYTTRVSPYYTFRYYYQPNGTTKF